MNENERTILLETSLRCARRMRKVFIVRLRTASLPLPVRSHLGINSLVGTIAQGLSASLLQSMPFHCLFNNCTVELYIAVMQHSSEMLCVSSMKALKSRGRALTFRPRADSGK